MDFHKIWYLKIFQKNVEKIWQRNSYFTWIPTYIYNISPEFFLEWEMFQRKIL
jgi:hypothetical protein